MKTILTVILILLTAVGIAVAKQPDGFRELAWGTELSALADLNLEKVPLPRGATSPVESYRSKNEDLGFAGAACEAITYNFLRGRLYSVTIDFNGSSNLSLIKEYCSKRFGSSSGTMVKDMEYFESFESSITSAMIYYQFAKHSFFVRYGRLFLFSRELDRELK